MNYLLNTATYCIWIDYVWMSRFYLPVLLSNVKPEERRISVRRTALYEAFQIGDALLTIHLNTSSRKLELMLDEKLKRIIDEPDYVWYTSVPLGDQRSSIEKRLKKFNSIIETAIGGATVATQAIPFYQGNPEQRWIDFMEESVNRFSVFVGEKIYGFIGIETSNGVISKTHHFVGGNVRIVYNALDHSLFCERVSIDGQLIDWPTLHYLPPTSVVVTKWDLMLKMDEWNCFLEDVLAKLKY